MNKKRNVKINKANMDEIEKKQQILELMKDQLKGIEVIYKKRRMHL